MRQKIVRRLYTFIINKLNGYTEKYNENQYLTLTPINKRKDTVKKYEELWTKIRDVVCLTSSDSDDDDKKYIKIKFDSYDDLGLKKTLELFNMIKFVKSVFSWRQRMLPPNFLRWIFVKITNVRKWYDWCVWGNWF